MHERNNAGAGRWVENMRWVAVCTRNEGSKKVDLQPFHLSYSALDGCC